MILAGIVGFIITAAGNALNDVLDVETDKINRPDRPIPSGQISSKSVLIFVFITGVISPALSLLFNQYAFIISFIAIVLLFFYSYKFKGVPLVGNIIVSLLTGLTFIFAGVVVENVTSAIIPAIFAFLINLIRELIKDMEDVEGDRSAGINTLPIKYGYKTTKYAVLTTAVILFLFTFVPMIFQIYKIEFFIIVMVVVNPILFYSVKLLFENSSKENLGKISSLLKFAMAAGLIAIYLGK